MRIEVDANRYVCCVLYGCETGSCFEYTGAIPSGYSSYDDWANKAKIQAYYLNSYGNLTYDANKAATIPDEDEIEGGTGESGGGSLLVDQIYPVGSIYMSVNSADPSTLFGGTWERIQDTFLLAAGSSYSAGSTGGAAKKSHDHIAPIGYEGSEAFGVVRIGEYEEGGKGKVSRSVDTQYSDNSLDSDVWLCHTSATEISTMPPYLAVYMWKRTA